MVTVVVPCMILLELNRNKHNGPFWDTVAGNNAQSKTLNPKRPNLKGPSHLKPNNNHTLTKT